MTNHLFNIDQSPLWIVQKLEVLHAVENGLLCEEVKYQRTYAPNPVPESQSIGAYGSAPGRHLESETRIPGKEILLRNCTDPARPEIIVKAMNVGLATVLGKRREVWDCGRLCIAPLAARTNAPANPPAQVATP